MTTASRVRLRLVGDERLVASVRRGDAAAFEALYDRHAAELLSFCVYMLGSRHDAEDALQATFAAAYRTLRADRRTVTLRPWLFAIARNNCLSILRRRRPWVELKGEPALDGDPLRELELREEVRLMIAGLRSLPESQRSSLLLAELHGFSQAEIGAVLGVGADQVKSFICQARSNLVSERSAREADCRDIREELATARGSALLRGRLRRHLRSCDDCRTYADGVARQRRHLGAILPLAPSLLLKYRALEEAFGTGVIADPGGYVGGTAMGGAVAGTAAEVAGGGFKAFALKFAAGVAFLGTGAGTGASVLLAPSTPASTAHLSAAATSASAGAFTVPSPRSDARTGRLAPAPPKLSSGPSRGGAGESLGSPAGVDGVRPGSRTPAAGTPARGDHGHRLEERELLIGERRLAREAQPAAPREGRTSPTGTRTPSERRHPHRQRLSPTAPRTVRTEAERVQSHEERVAAARSHSVSKEQHRRERERRATERAERPPKSEAEKLEAREERRLRRREEEQAETPSG